MAILMIMSPAWAADLGEVMQEVTGVDGLQMMRCGVGLRQEKNPDFVLAVNRAATISDMMACQAITEMSPEIEAAIAP